MIAALVSPLLASCSGGGGGYELVAEFDKAVSLYASSSVRVLGLPSGKVTKVQVVGDHVRVTMRINDDVPVPADVQATIIPLSLIGERYVQLFPAWTDGVSRARPGTVIPRNRTSIPVEPDEALAAFKEFLDALDPQATGRLVKNLADDLQGNGQRLNDALGGLGRLAGTLADKDVQLAQLIDNFDDLTVTVATREKDLGLVLRRFATTASVLAAERASVQALLEGLAKLSVDGLDLVGEHGPRLEHDITVLSRTLRSVSVHLDSVLALLDSGPLVVAGPDLDGTRGLAASYDPKYHHLDLRSQFSPTVGQALQGIGIPGGETVCLPVDVGCAPPPPYVKASVRPSKRTTVVPTWMRSAGRRVVELIG
ncbi:MAG TPA: MCE family protein [Acidimicrobiales bacterium]|nr:MCE family protein [Acidimicrobiales bacterium]